MGGVFFTWEPWVYLLQFPTLASNEAEGRSMAKAIYGAADWASFDQGRLSETQIAQSVASRLNAPVALIQDLVNRTPSALGPIASTAALLSDLAAARDAGAKHRLWYLSNMPATYARQLQANHDWFNCFDGGLFSADIDMVKPNDDIFHHTAERFGFEPADAVFIDDHPANIEAAQALGWATIHVQDAADLPNQLRNWLGTPTQNQFALATVIVAAAAQSERTT